MSGPCTMILASRGDELGRAWAKDVHDTLSARFPGELELQPITADIDEAPLPNQADVAVHRGEHLPIALPAEFTIGAYLPRRAFTDALVSDFSFRELPAKAKVATSDLRRRAMLLRAKPGLNVVEDRGTIRERLQRWRIGDSDALVLPTAGLRRLEIDAPHEELDPGQFVPSAGQGAVACVCKVGSPFEKFLKEIDDPRTRMEVEVERAVLRGTGGLPGLPVGVHAAQRGGSVSVHAVVLSLDGRRAVTWRDTIAASDALYHADEFAERLKGMGADVLLAKARRAVA